LLNLTYKRIVQPNVSIPNGKIVTFEAANEVVLQSGFQILPGGLLENSMNGCEYKNQ
jgi:hypothetical protein